MDEHRREPPLVVKHSASGFRREPKELTFLLDEDVRAMKSLFPRKRVKTLAQVRLKPDTPDADIVMTNEAYRERYNRDNPNIAIIHALKQAGVDIRVCGQGILARKIDPKQVNPDINIDLWAMTTLVNLQLKGYVRVG